MASQAGVDGLEWIFDGVEGNPIQTDEGIREIRQCAERWGIPVLSACADIYMTRPLTVEHLEWLADRVRRLGAGHLVLPFLEGASLQHLGPGVSGWLARLLPIAERSGVALHLETDFAPTAMAAAMESLDHPLMRVTYDIGNATSYGQGPTEVLSNLGRWIGSVHVKDRLLGGGSVPLGDGDADFASVFHGLAEYSGPYTLQAAREPGISEVALARRNRLFVLEHLRCARWSLA